MILCAYSTQGRQTINPGENAIFTIVEVPCTQGYVRPRLSAGTFLLAGGPQNRRRCPCCNMANQTRDYLVDVKADIAVSEGGTAGPITVALALEGSSVQSSIMTVTPAAAEEFFNVSGAIPVDVFRGCCEFVSLKNTSSQPIDLQNGVIVFALPELDRR